MRRCAYCLSRLPDSAASCPSCGFNASCERSVENRLPIGARLNGRYVLGGVLRAKKDFTDYYGFDSRAGKRVLISEYFKEGFSYRLDGEFILKYYDETGARICGGEISAFYSYYKTLLEVAKNSVLDFVDCFAENSTFYFVRRVRSGEPLSSLVGNGERLAMKKAVSLLGPVFDCAIKLEAAGKRHGSISPYSILTDGKKVTSLTDCLYSSKSLYSPFDAPEKRLGASKYGPGADVYSLGAILYEATVGKPPPSADERALGKAPTFPDGFPENDEKILRKALALNTNQRYKSPAELLDALSGKRKTAADKSFSVFEAVRKTALCAATVVLAASLGFLAKSYIIEPRREDERASEFASMLQTAKDDSAEQWKALRKKYPDVNFPKGMNPAFADIYALNPDLAGWISIPALGINYPALQAKDNDKYLRRDFYGKRTSYGTPFFDYRNSLAALDRNTIIYGHNMRRDDKIFGVLEQYRTVEGFRKAPVINMSTLYGDYYFKVYAVFITNSLPRDDGGRTFNYIFTSASDERFAGYIKEIDKRKLYSTGVDINRSDKILTLSTCCYDFEDARLAVAARLTREGESAATDLSLARKNENPKFPQAYYDARGLKNPYKNDPDEFDV